jgi:hypothetical protein
VRARGPGDARIDTLFDVRTTGHRDIYCRRKAIEKANSFEALIDDQCAWIVRIDAMAVAEFLTFARG